MNELAKLKDIKPIVKFNIPENHTPYNYTLLWIGIILITFCLIILFIFIRKKLKIKKEKKELFSLIDNPKKFAYEFKKAKKFVNNKNKELFEKINKRLIDYKYKKDVKPIDEETKNLIKEFLGVKWYLNIN